MKNKTFFIDTSTLKLEVSASALKMRQATTLQKHNL